MEFFWSRPRPCWPGSRPIAWPCIGRATEPRLAVSRGSRHIRVTVARPTPMILESFTIQVGCYGHDDSRDRLARSRYPFQPVQFLCSAWAPFLRPGLRIANAVARSGRQGWPVLGPPGGPVLDGREHDGSLSNIGTPWAPWHTMYCLQTCFANHGNSRCFPVSELHLVAKRKINKINNIRPRTTAFRQQAASSIACRKTKREVSNHDSGNLGTEFEKRRARPVL